MAPEAFFVPDGPDSFVATAWTRSPPSALLAGACEKRGAIGRSEQSLVVEPRPA